MITLACNGFQVRFGWNRQGQVTPALMRACSLGSSFHLSMGLIGGQHASTLCRPPTCTTLDRSCNSSDQSKPIAINACDEWPAGGGVSSPPKADGTSQIPRYQVDTIGPHDRRSHA
jgi:hypothetical protein